MFDEQVIITFRAANGHRTQLLPTVPLLNGPHTWFRYPDYRGLFAWGGSGQVTEHLLRLYLIDVAEGRAVIEAGPGYTGPFAICFCDQHHGAIVEDWEQHAATVGAHHCVVVIAGRVCTR